MSSSEFAYKASPFRYVAKYRDGRWEEGHLSDDENVVLNESACVLQYAQNVFEGLKARKTEDGRIIIFRPDRNAARMTESCIRMAMPPYPEDLFLKAVEDVVRANAGIIPLGTDGSSFYLRPFMFGTDPVLGVRPATEYEFRVFGSVVGKYFSRMIRLRVCDMDRVAPHGTGHVKAGLNYAMSLYAITEAHALGYDENLYLDSTTRTYLEETGGANIFFITKDGKLVTPRSETILPSITRDSLLTVASRYLGIEAVERQISIDEISEFAECGLCGTAAVISPVESIDDHGTVHRFFLDAGPEDSVTGRLRKVLTEIQQGERPAPEGWIHEVSLK